MQGLKLYLQILFVFFVGHQSYAQLKSRTIKANSTKVIIKDGWEGKTRYWNHLIKSTSPILYHLSNTNTQRQVTFYTDKDSISFTVNKESDYPFDVIVNTSDTCHVVLTTKNYEYSTKNNIHSDIDTLPFTFNKNRQLIIQGRINNCRTMNFCVDLGARMVYVIGKGLDKSNKLNIDGMMEDESVTGLSTEKTSSDNALQLGNLTMNHTPVCYIDEAGFLDNGGGLVGFNIFQDKIVELDFDNKLLLIHKKLPEKHRTYSQIEFKQTTGGLYIPIIISNGKTESTGWYFFDTGADNALTFDSKFALREGLKNTLQTIGKSGIASSENRVIEACILEVPEVMIANYKLKNVPSLLASESNTEAEFEDGVIGIGLQCRFNFIIDFSNSKMYLKPTRYFSEPFNKKDHPMLLITGLVGGIGLILIGLVIFKKKRQRIKTEL